MNARSNRGTTLLMSMIMLVILSVIVGSVLSYATLSHTRASELSRGEDRQRCVQEGLQLSKSYFGRNSDKWNVYLGDPANYNPIRSTWTPVMADPMDPVLRTAHPELFADFDGDGVPDVYIYIRDNPDEVPAKWNLDNDGIVIVGAMCISSTMSPGMAITSSRCSVNADCVTNPPNVGAVCIKLPAATVGQCVNPLTMEAMIEFLGGDTNQYRGQDGSGPKQTGNMN